MCGQARPAVQRLGMHVKIIVDISDMAAEVTWVTRKGQEVKRHLRAQANRHGA